MTCREMLSLLFPFTPLSPFLLPNLLGLSQAVAARGEFPLSNAPYRKGSWGPWSATACFRPSRGFLPVCLSLVVFRAFSLHVRPSWYNTLATSHSMALSWRLRFCIQSARCRGQYVSFDMSSLPWHICSATVCQAHLYTPAWLCQGRPVRGTCMALHRWIVVGIVWH